MIAIGGAATKPIPSPFPAAVGPDVRAPAELDECGYPRGHVGRSVGVVRTPLARRQIRCACLGSVFNLPMSSVALAEDALMAAMPAVLLATGGHV